MPAPQRLDALTGLRFLAAAGVAFAHMPHLQAAADLGPTAKRLFLEGGVGVPFFFVLSGFVLAYTYHARLAAPTRGELGRYYAARVGRVWPVHLLTLGLAALAIEAGTPIGPTPGGAGPALANAFLVHAWVPDVNYVQSYNSVSWSLSLEAFFYLTLPLVLWSAARKPVGPVWLTLGTLLVWLPVFLLVSWHVRHPGDWTLFVLGFCPPVRLGEFVAGVWLGLAFVRSGAVAGPAPTLRGRLLWTAAELAAVAAFAGLLTYSDRAHPFYRFHVYYTPALAAIVAVFARQRGVLSNLLASRVTVFLGEISFSFFMLHCVVFVTVNHHVSSAAGGTLGHTLLLLAAAGLASTIVYRLYELPLRGWVVRRATPGRGRAVVPGSPPRAVREVAPLR